MENEQNDYLIPPPGPGEIRFLVAAGADVELSDSAKAALETLVAELVADDVSGFMAGASLAPCDSHCFIEICVGNSSIKPGVRFPRA
jgi:hypothetical protein